jgi:hypothetical protein
MSAICGSHLKHEELVSFNELATKRPGTRLDRDAGRRNIVMVKWFAENWGVLEPLLSNIILEQEEINCAQKSGRSRFGREW